RPTGTASTAAATDRPTKRSTGSPSAACAGTPAPAPTWNDAPKTACPRRRSSAASNATSPASSTSSSPHQTILNSPLDIHRSIPMRVRCRPACGCGAVPPRSGRAGVPGAGSVPVAAVDPLHGPAARRRRRTPHRPGRLWGAVGGARRRPLPADRLGGPGRLTKGGLRRGRPAPGFECLDLRRRGRARESDPPAKPRWRGACTSTAEVGMRMAASMTAPREITAAVVREKGAFELTTAVLDPPRDDEVLVRVVAAGLCHTDLVVRDQVYPVPLPVVLGHEGAGVVEAVGGAVEEVAPGDHVAVSFLPCGRCRPCLDGSPASCANFNDINFAGRRPDGSHALRLPDGGTLHDRFFGQSSFGTYAIAHERNTVKVRADAPLELLGPLG